MSTSADRWSALHHGIDPARVPLLMPWLRLMWLLARPLRAVPPVVLTVCGVLCAVAAAVLAAPLPWAALGLVLAAVLCDGLDGAVAVLAGRASAAGARLDAVADRISDAAFAAVLWGCGVPWGVALACGAVAIGVDVLRRVRRVPDRITAGERPTWTVCTVLACGAAGVTAAQWPVLVCAAVWLAAATVALAQVLAP